MGPNAREGLRISFGRLRGNITGERAIELAGVKVKHVDGKFAIHVEKERVECGRRIEEIDDRGY